MSLKVQNKHNINLRQKIQPFKTKPLKPSRSAFERPIDRDSFYASEAKMMGPLSFTDLQGESIWPDAQWVSRRVLLEHLTEYAHLFIDCEKNTTLSRVESSQKKLLDLYDKAFEQLSKLFPSEKEQKRFLSKIYGNKNPAPPDKEGYHKGFKNGGDQINSFFCVSSQSRFSPYLNQYKANQHLPS